MDSRDRGWLIVLAVVLLIVLLGTGLGWGMMGWGMMGPGMMHWWGAATSQWWGVAMLAFWVLIIAGVGLLLTWGLRQVGPSQDAGRRPLDILKERYARGEISREQYEQMRRDLE